MDRYEGFREFVAARERALLRSAYLLTGNRHQAEDLVQTALVKVAPRWARLIRAGDPEAYIRKVMYHQHISWWRSKGARAEIPAHQPPERADAVDFTAATMVRLVLRQALVRLTRRQRAVLVLRFFEDRSEAETAELLGCSVGTVKSQAHRALARLRELAPELADLTSRTTTRPEARR